jgi:lipase chaperone LimK
VWVHYFQQIIQGNNFINEKEAKYYIEKGKRAIDLNDVEELKRCVHNLMLLLPREQQENIKKNLSGITH